jgi:hypothetical protein
VRTALSPGRQRASGAKGCVLSNPADDGTRSHWQDTLLPSTPGGQGDGAASWARQPHHVADPGGVRSSARAEPSRPGPLGDKPAGQRQHGQRRDQPTGLPGRLGRAHRGAHPRMPGLPDLALGRRSPRVAGGTPPEPIGQRCWSCAFPSAAGAVSLGGTTGDDIAGDVCFGPLKPAKSPPILGMQSALAQSLGCTCTLCALYSVHVSPQPVRWLGARPRYGGASAFSAHQVAGLWMVPFWSVSTSGS